MSSIDQCGVPTWQAYKAVYDVGIECVSYDKNEAHEAYISQRLTSTKFPQGWSFLQLEGVYTLNAEFEVDTLVDLTRGNDAVTKIINGIVAYAKEIY